MATQKFKDTSPYQKSKPRPPTEDHLYASYESHVELNPGTLSYRKITIALFGAGRAGTIHLSNITKNPRVEIAYIVDDVESKWAAIKSFWNLEKTTFLSSKNSAQVFKDSRVSAVIIASPTYTHEELVKAALNNGKAVFCEKPVAGNIAITSHCYQLAKQVGQPLFCAFNRRFDSSYSHLRQKVQAGTVGHVHTIKVCSRDSPLPTTDYLRVSGGIFHDCAVHDIDMMCWILGEYPSKVFSMANANVPEIAEMGDWDTVAMVLNFPSGTIGMIDLSRNSSYGYDQRLEVFGPKGMVQCNNQRPLSGYETNINLEGNQHMPMWYSFPSRYHAAYATEMEHFLDVIDGKATSSVLGLETLAVSKIATALEESAKTGQSVTLTWKPEELPPTVISV